MNKEPNFIVAGAPKAGTTWLYQCLKEHPNIFVSTPKELHYFSRDRCYEKGIAWYLSYFQDVEETIVGEVCPSYMYLEKVPPRIYEWNPHVKLIFMVRNPIDRAYSEYCMNIDHWGDTTDIEQALSASGKIAHCGLYYQQIQEFLKLFPQEQIQILLYDDLKKDPEGLLMEVYNFLGADETFKPEILNKRENSRKPPPRNMAIYQPIRSLYLGLLKQYPKTEVILNTMRKKGYLNLFYKVMRGGTYPKLSREIACNLAFFYKEDVHDLSSLLNRDLSHWLDSYLD